jgi:hypothetical protein
MQCDQSTFVLSKLVDLQSSQYHPHVTKVIIIKVTLLRGDSSKQAVTHIRECRGNSSQYTPCKGKT